MDVGTIILAVGALVLLIVLFFVAELITKEKAKKDEAESDAKPDTETHAAENNKIQQGVNISAPENDYYKELNQNNLANDIESLIEKDKKNDSVKYESASRRSHLATRGRMKDYYERRHLEHTSRNNYGIKYDATENEIEIEDLKFSEDEIKKLIALQEVLKRKDS